MKDAAEIKAEILRLAREYSRLKHGSNLPAGERKDAFAPGVSTIPYAGRVFNEDEVEAAVSATLDFWLTLGPEGEAFEKELAAFLGVKKSLLVNSGSSANLLAFSALTSSKLGSRRIRPGDEVITAAAGFPPPSRPSSRMAAFLFFSMSIPSRSTCASINSKKPLFPAKPKPSSWPTPWAIPSISRPLPNSAAATTSGSSRTIATRSAHSMTANSPAPSVTFPRSPSIPRTI
jgi:CDP-6-deoxy-D-xylo-4-hexulose-3-dehydrase